MNSVRSGFAMFTVLWALAILSAVAASTVADVRYGVRSSAARVRSIEALWEARGCAAKMRVSVDALLRSAGDAGLAWRRLHIVSVPPSCEMRLRPDGARRSLKDLSATELRALLVAVQPGEDASALVDAILDWRDADDDARVNGAERAWYRGEGRPGPSNLPFESVDELAAVRGLGPSHASLGALTIDSAMVSLLHAPVAVLASLPGSDVHLARAIIAHREAAWQAPHTAAFAATMPVDVRDRLIALSSAWAPQVTLDPGAWVVEVRVHGGDCGAVYAQVWRRDAQGVVIVHETTP